MKNYLKILAWISGGLGLLMILFGTIAAIAGGILFNHRWDNYFYPATPFLIAGIFLLLMEMADKK